MVIRREHEGTHYFTLRAFGIMRNNLFDELVADFAGLAGAYGRYDGALALRFFGLESYPDYRSGGRFENYLETPPIGRRLPQSCRNCCPGVPHSCERCGPSGPRGIHPSGIGW